MYPVGWSYASSFMGGTGKSSSDCTKMAVRHHGFHSESPRLSDLSRGGRKEKGMA